MKTGKIRPDPAWTTQICDADATKNRFSSFELKVAFAVHVRGRVSLKIVVEPRYQFLRSRFNAFLHPNQCQDGQLG